MKSKNEERKHHPYSPSQLGNLEVCPCYIGKDSTHIRTIVGSKAHRVAETMQDDHELSDDDAAAAAECIDFADSRRRLMQAQADAHYRDKGGDPKKYKVKELKEQYLPVDDITFADGIKSTTAGYVDLCLLSWDKKYAELIDYKFGLWPVEDARYNLQGLAYVLGLFKKYPSLQSVRLFFKQPLLGTVSNWTVTRDGIPSIYLRIQTVVARAREARTAGDFSSANPTVPVCNYCGNLGKCPKVAAIMLRVSQKYHPLGVPDNVTPTMVMSMTDTKMCLNVASVAASWADSYKRSLNDRVLRGEAPIPEGMKLVSKQDREIVDKEKFRAVCEGYFRPMEFIDICTPSFTAAEKKVSDIAPRGEKSAAVQRFAEELLSSGAVVKGQPYAYLRAIPAKSEEPSTNLT